MPLLFIYLFETSICLVGFYTLYHFLFKDMTTFQHNRIYFLLSYLLSFLIPFISLDVFPIFIDVVNNATETSVNQRLTPELISHEEAPWMIICLGFYSLVVVLFLGRLFLSVWNILNAIRNSFRHDKGEFVIVENTINDQTFTFFKFFFQPKSKIIDKEVAAHEMIHIKQWHSLDIILSEVIKAILWFNPIAHIMQNKIKLNHEFICDAFAASNSTPYKYAQFLSSAAKSNQNLILVSNFAYKLKNRIIMLEKSIHHKSNLWRYISLFPTLLVLLFFFSFEDYVVAQNVEPINTLEPQFEKMIISDTITVYDPVSRSERIDVVNKEVDAVEIIDTITMFDYETYEESVRIERRLVPVSQVGSTNEYDVDLNKTQNKVESFGIDTVTVIDYETGESHTTIVERTNYCYGFFWGYQDFNYSHSITVKEAQELMSRNVYILKQKDSKCEDVKNINARVSIVPPNNIDPVMFMINKDQNKLPNNSDIKSRLISGTKLFIDGVKVNDDITMRSIIINIE